MNRVRSVGPQLVPLKKNAIIAELDKQVLHGGKTPSALVAT